MKTRYVVVYGQMQVWTNWDSLEDALADLCDTITKALHCYQDVAGWHIKIHNGEAPE